MSGCGGCNGKLPRIKSHISKDVINKTKEHPCYSPNAGDYARMHIPVAPKCNIQCNYCNRKFDCQNESRPGVTSKVMSPREALEHYKNVSAKIDKLSVVGIAGPGDALANFEETRKSIQLIRDYDPKVTFCISTNGLLLYKYGKDLVDLNINHITITINAIDPDLAGEIYKFIYYKGKRYTGREAGEIIINNQLEGLKFLSSQNVICKVNIVYIKGVNDFHVEEVVKKVAECGASIVNIMPLIPAEGTYFSTIPLTSKAELMIIRKRCEKYIPQMYHCKQCRADAVGRLNEECKNKKQIG